MYLKLKDAVLSTEPCCAGCADGGACSGDAVPVGGTEDANKTGDASKTEMAAWIGLPLVAGVGLALLLPHAWERFHRGLWGK